jgi:cell division protein FtsB
VGVAGLLSFVLSDSFRQVIIRRRAIHGAETQLRRVEAETAEAREKLARLENDPRAYEKLVRQELGYLRPGEKEARFLNK